MRKEKDPVYRLLFFPEECITEFLDTARKIVNKKYGEKLRDNRCVAAAWDVMISKKYDDDDAQIKIVVLLATASREPELAAAIEKCYQLDGGIHGAKGPQMFRKLLVATRNFVDQLFGFHYNTQNIVECIHNFVKAAKHEYVIGSLQ